MVSNCPEHTSWTLVEFETIVTVSLDLFSLAIDRTQTVLSLIMENDFAPITETAQCSKDSRVQKRGQDNIWNYCSC